MTDDEHPASRRLYANWQNLFESRIAALEENQAVMEEHLRNMSAQTLRLTRLVKDIALLIQTAHEDDEPVH